MIRAENEQDRGAIARVNELAFGKPNEARLVEAIRASDRFVPELSLVSEEDGEVVGHVLLSYVDLNGTRVLLLGPLAVLPARQRRGIGSALVEHALNAADARREPLVLLEGDPRYYGRLGFDAAGRYGIEPPGPLPEGIFQVRLLAAYDPSLRGRVRYPPAFDDV